MAKIKNLSSFMRRTELLLKYLVGIRIEDDKESYSRFWSSVYITIFGMLVGIAVFGSYFSVPAWLAMSVGCTILCNLNEAIMAYRRYFPFNERVRKSFS